MAQALPYQNKILRNLDKTVEHATLIAQFGDGYSQRMPDGINSKRDTWSIIWGNLYLTEMQSVESVLDTAGGSGVLLWTPHYESVQKKFIIKNGTYKRTTVNNNSFEIRCDLVEVFDVV